MRILKYAKGTAFPSGYDYAFEKLKDFKKLLPYLYKKIDGTWLIVLVGLNTDNMNEITKELSIPDYIDLRIYLKPDVFQKFMEDNPNSAVKEKTHWELYMDYVSSLNVLIAPNALKELYKRCRGSLPLIQEKVESILLSNSNIQTISIKEVNSVVERVPDIYARDVILSFWIKNNKLVAKKGSRLSLYKYGNPYDRYSIFVKTLGRDYAFYALRSFLRKIYDEKLKYLDCKDVKDKEICQYVDINTILFSYLTFELSNPRQLFACIEIIGRRELEDVSIFKETILAHND